LLSVLHSYAQAPALAAEERVMQHPREIVAYK
jgi:hypothetical protein